MTEREIKYEAFVRDDIANNRGRMVNAMAEVEYLLAHPEACEIFSRHYLDAILSYATAFSEFYRPYRGFKSLQDFPIITKTIMKENWDAIAVPEYDSVLKEKRTSGSTGTPFRVVLDKYKHSRLIATLKVVRASVGVLSHEKTLFVSGSVRWKTPIPQERQERDNVYYVDSGFMDSDSVGAFIKRLSDENFRTMTAMASHLDRIAYLAEHKQLPEWTGDFIAVFSTSEALKESTREIISEYFRCPVYSFYGNEENGMFSFEDGSGLGQRVNTADFFFEVLKMDSDTPADEGELGRLVITDLFNKAFPMIRYENGDLVAKKTMDDGRVYFTQVAGRKADMLYATDGRMIQFFAAASFLRKFIDIKQFQVIQEDYHNFTLILNTDNRSYEEEMVRQLRSVFGEDSYYKFEYVDEIPKLRSGKHRMTVCKIPGVN
ncbi:MAG: hypothetical protein IJP89_06155 [Synergistaceae bacterium]|nr:hypothetical protein [Synergistaceae bacterium]MBR0256650.1 hypothetical protein [Synergistaceae bacterium]